MTHCATCGRPETDGESDTGSYCSEACREHPPDERDRRLERAVRELARSRGPDKTFCPSEAAKRVDPEDWRELMDRTRLAAARLEAEGVVEVTRGGEAVDPRDPGGPIRIGLREQ